MAQNVHSQAPHHLPGFLPGADGSDVLFTFVVVLVIVIVLGLGVLYFTVHALPEKMAHKANSTQLQLIGVLSLLALFTHNNLFWVFALLFAAIRVPDIVTPLKSISQSLENLKFLEPAPIVSAPKGAPESQQALSPDKKPQSRAPVEKREPAPNRPVPQSHTKLEDRES